MNESIEYIILNSHNSLNREFIMRGRKEEFLKNLPFYATVTDIETKSSENTIEGSSIFRTQKPTLDMFLTQQFGIDLFRFMQIYSKLHVGEEFVVPVPRFIICMFLEENSLDSLKLKLLNRENILTLNLNDGPLHLHDSSIHIFSLIKCKNCKISESEYVGAYRYSTEYCDFVIKSTNQFDLTIAYEKRNVEP